jgi:hypothetical protein
MSSRMAIDLATLPQFLTRDNAAELLRLTTKSIDTMAGDGRLEKVKLGARRPGIRWSDYVGDLCGVSIDTEDYDSESLHMLCQALDVWLPKHGLKGCMVFGNVETMGVRVMWHSSMGYSTKKIARSVKALIRAMGGQPDV